MPVLFTQSTEVDWSETDLLPHAVGDSDENDSDEDDIRK